MLSGGRPFARERPPAVEASLPAIPIEASHTTPDPDTRPTSPDAPASGLHASCRFSSALSLKPDYSPYAKHRSDATAALQTHTPPVPAPLPSHSRCPSAEPQSSSPLPRAGDPHPAEVCRRLLIANPPDAGSPS